MWSNTFEQSEPFVGALFRVATYETRQMFLQRQAQFIAERQVSARAS